MESGDDAARRFTATGAAAGFVYQIRYALLTLARLASSDPGASITIEHLDDIEVATGRGGTRIQTKHHLGDVSLTDRSPEIWKTLRIWAEQVAADDSLPEQTLFLLVTTAEAPVGSIASLLREIHRDIVTAQRRLDDVAVDQPSEVNRPGCKAWLSLTGTTRGRLLAAIRVIDGSENNVDIARALEGTFYWAARTEDMRRRIVREVEGWWANRVAVHFSTTGDRIGAAELDERVRTIAELLRPDDLPLPEGLEQTVATLTEDDEVRILVRQLRLLEYSDVVVVRALTDFFRAETVISEAMRERLYFLAELTRYHGLLKDEWDQRFVLLLEDVQDAADPAALIHAGRRIYAQIMELTLPIRPNRQDPFIMRGVYHALADKLEVGWHPHFKEALL